MIKDRIDDDLYFVTIDFNGIVNNWFLPIVILFYYLNLYNQGISK